MNIKYDYNELTKTATLSMSDVEVEEEIIPSLFAAAAINIAIAQGHSDQSILEARKLLSVSPTSSVKLERG